jgi:alpha-L-fucosidase
VRNPGLDTAVYANMLGSMLQPWFSQAKLGIFIHWGIYAVDGVVESWPFFNQQMTYEAYMEQLGGFTAKRYDPRDWAKLFHRVGAKYAVLTTKHHDGVALWDTALSDLNVVEKTPAGRDLVGPYCDALRRKGIKVGLYFSHLDWSHPDYATMFNDPHPLEPWVSNKYAYPQPPNGASPARWERFLAFHRGQLEELCSAYRPDLLWFDGDWDRTDQVWRMGELREQLHAWAPGVILNSRMKGHGDFETPEQGQPLVAPRGPWEYCVTLNDSWGYRPTDRNYKPIDRLIRMYVETVGMGGNFLIDVGPKADGTIPREQRALLEKLGRWNRRNGEAIFGTGPGLPHGHYHGPSTISADRKSLHVFLFDQPRHGIQIKGITGKVRRATLLGHRGKLTFTHGEAAVHGVPAPLWIDVPKRGLDPWCSVVKVDFAEPIALYRGEGAVITQN